jgi:hypothetical protein
MSADVWSVPRRVAAVSDNGRVIVYTDGLVLTEGSDPVLGAGDLNQVFAAAMIEGIYCNAALLIEVAHYTVDPVTYAIRSDAGPVTTLRATLRTPSESPTPQDWGRRITTEELHRVLNTAEQMRWSPTLATESALLLQADTAMRSAEHDQAFFLSWLIFERQFVGIWNRYLDATGVPVDRLARFRRCSIGAQLKVLNFSGELDDASFECLHRLKGARNRFVHGAAHVSRSDAADLVRVATALIEAQVTHARFQQLLRERMNVQRKAGNIK